MTSSIIGMVYNFQLRFAGKDGVAFYGVLMYTEFIFVAVFIGYAIGSAGHRLSLRRGKHRGAQEPAAQKCHAESWFRHCDVGNCPGAGDDVGAPVCRL